MGRFPSSSYHRTPWAAFPREAPSPAEPGQGARHSPAGWHRQANVPALGGDPGAAGCPSHTQLNWESLGGCHLPPGATGLQLCFGSLKALRVLCQQFAATGGDALQLGRGPRGDLLLPTDKGRADGRLSAPRPQTQAGIGESSREAGRGMQRSVRLAPQQSG